MFGSAVYFDRTWRACNTSKCLTSVKTSRAALKCGYEQRDTVHVVLVCLLVRVIRLTWAKDRVHLQLRSWSLGWIWGWTWKTILLLEPKCRFKKKTQTWVGSNPDSIRPWFIAGSMSPFLTQHANIIGTVHSNLEFFPGESFVKFYGWI